MCLEAFLRSEYEAMLADITDKWGTAPLIPAQTARIHPDIPAQTLHWQMDLSQKESFNQAPLCVLSINLFLLPIGPKSLHRRAFLPGNSPRSIPPYCERIHFSVTPWLCVRSWVSTQMDQSAISSFTACTPLNLWWMVTCWMTVARLPPLKPLRSLMTSLWISFKNCCLFWLFYCLFFCLVIIKTNSSISEEMLVQFKKGTTLGLPIGGVML